jgi:hypothetical protein
VSCLVDTLFEEEPALATVPDRFFLELLREQAEGRRQLEEKFARTLEVAHAAGVAIPLLAEAAGLTASRIHARLQKQRTLPPDLDLLADDEVKEVLEHAFDVAIVAAGRVGYPEYRRYGAYICQAGRAFRNDPRYFAFYANSEVKPEIAAVLGRRDQLLFTPETAQQLRDQGEAGLAAVVEQAVRDGAPRPVGRSSSTCSQPRTTSARSRSHNRSPTPPPARAAASFAASATPRSPRSSNSRTQQPSYCATSARTE